MSKQTITPGPWKVNGDGYSISFDGGPRSETVLHPYEPRYPTKEELADLGDECHDDWFIATSGDNLCCRSTEEIEANAQAIAAVPDMIEALRCAIPWLAKILADGTHLKCAMPRDAEMAYERANNALRKAGQID